MKIIWMSTTLGLLSTINSEAAQEIVNLGTIKTLESGFKYIIIEEN
jgi:hypothetical protein